MFSLSFFTVPVPVSGQEATPSAEVLGEIAGGIKNIEVSSEKCAEPVSEPRQCPEPDPCPACPKPSVTGGDISPRNEKLASSDLEFLRVRVVAVLEEKRLDREYAGALLGEIDNYIAMYWSHKRTADVLFWKAEIFRREKKHEAMLVTVTKLIYEYPGSEYDDWARESVNALFSKDLKRHKVYDQGILDGPGSGSRADRFVKMLELISSFREKKYYPIIVEQCEEFLRRYPRHERSDLVLTYKASALVEMREYRGSALALERLVEQYPRSSIRSASLFELARIYADRLKEYEKAVDSYEEIVSAYPDGPETLSSYQNMALVYEKRLKRAEGAVRALEAIVTKYPGTPEALAAFKQMADVQVSAKDYKAAVDSLSRLADMFKGEEAIKALEEGAKLAVVRLKYYELEIELLQRVVDEYPESENAGYALYSIGSTMEKKLGNTEGAINAYKSLVEKYPGHKRASSAKKRVDKLLTQ